MSANRADGYVTRRCRKCGNTYEARYGTRDRCPYKLIHERARLDTNDPPAATVDHPPLRPDENR